MVCVTRRRVPLVGRWSVAAMVVGVAGWLFLGCGSSPDVALDGGTDLPTSEPDIGTHEPADECYWGAQFADCGGDGTPRFACPSTGLGCYWFTGGVVAQGFLAWPCADGRICCEEGPDAGFPHHLDIYPAAFFGQYGAEPWTRERALDLGVTLDPLLTGEVEVDCEREGSAVDDVGPCLPPQGTPESMNPYVVYSDMRDTLTVSVFQVVGLGSQGITIEIMLGDTPDALMARVCESGTTDLVVVSCETSTYPVRECADEGSIRLSAAPTRDQADLSGVVVAGEAIFPSGLEVSFTVPL